jgi:biopolymer transport protein ExbD
VFTREKLNEMLKRMVAVNPNQPVRIRGDAQMSWQRMADVISTCSQAGVWNVSFSKQMPEAKK